MKPLSYAASDHCTPFTSNVKSRFDLAVLKVSSIPPALKEGSGREGGQNLPIIFCYYLHQKYNQPPETALSQLNCRLGK